MIFHSLPYALEAGSLLLSLELGLRPTKPSILPSPPSTALDSQAHTAVPDVLPESRGFELRSSGVHSKRFIERTISTAPLGFSRHPFL